MITKPVWSQIKGRVDEKKPTADRRVDGQMTLKMDWQNSIGVYGTDMRGDDCWKPQYPTLNVEVGPRRDETESHGMELF